MKVKNMLGSTGREVANQFIITGKEGKKAVEVFQSYNSVIVKRVYGGANGVKTYLDKNTWDYSITTGRYRNQFLGETKKETQAKIDSGEYKLADLN